MIPKQENLLLPFQILINQFESELEATRATLIGWEKARSGSAPGTGTPGNNQLDEKIRLLEKGKMDLETFTQELKIRLESEDVAPDEIANEVRSSLAAFTATFGEIRALLNYRYSTTQKNEINRRITAINASRMLNNADMKALQHLWTGILNMENDERLVASKKVLEARLYEWEKLIAEKNHSSIHH